MRLGFFRPTPSCRVARWDRLVRTVRKCRLLPSSKRPDGLCSPLQSAHKGDIIARAGWDKAAAFGVLQSPPFLIAPFLSHSVLTDYTPLPHCPQYPPPTTGQFVPPAWLPPPLLPRYLAPLLHFNGRYWLENFHDLSAIPQKSLLPFPATFNLITGFLQRFKGGPSQGDNGRASGFTNTLPRVIWFTRGAASALLSIRWLRGPSVPPFSTLGPSHQTSQQTSQCCFSLC